MTPISIETVFGGIVSLLMAAFWYWVKSIADGLKEAQRERDSLRDELHEVKLGYATKQEAAANQQNVMAALGRLENKVDKLGDKLDRKADKS